MAQFSFIDEQGLHIVDIVEDGPTPSSAPAKAKQGFFTSVLTVVVLAAVGGFGWRLGEYLMDCLLFRTWVP